MTVGAQNIDALHPKTDGHPATLLALQKPIVAAPGREIRISGPHDRRRIAVWVDA